MPKSKRKKLKTDSAPSINNNLQLFDSLPDEVNIKILTYLNPQDLVNVSQVSTKFYKLSNDKVLWQSHLDNLLVKDTPKTLFFKMKNGRYNIALGIINLLRNLEEAESDGEDESDEKFSLADGTEISSEELAYKYYYEEFSKIILNYKPVVVAEKILEMLEEGEIHLEITSIGCIDQTFLHFFATTLDIDALQLLIDSKLNINEEDKFGTTPVELIFEFGPPNIDILNFLIDNNANFDSVYTNESDEEESDEEESDEEKSDEEESKSKPEENVICNICLKNAFNEDYLKALAFLIEKEVFINNKQITEYIHSKLDPVRKEVFNKHLKSFTNQISNII